MMRRTASLLPLLAALAWLTGCADDQSLGPAAEQPSFIGAGRPAQQNRIPNQYIVVFNDNVASPVQLANGLAVAHGLRLRHTYRHAIKGFSAVFPANAAAALRRNPNVRFVEQNAYAYVDTHERLRARPTVSFSIVVADATATRAKRPLRAPTNLHHTAVTDIQIDLRWEDQNADETGWEVWRSVTGPNGTFKIHEEVSGPPGPEGSYTDDEFGRGGLTLPRGSPVPARHLPRALATPRSPSEFYAVRQGCQETPESPGPSRGTRKRQQDPVQPPGRSTRRTAPTCEKM